MTEAPKKRGRPRKVRPAEGETPATVVSPVVEESTNPVVLNEVEELDPVTDEVIARHPDPMDEVEIDPEGFTSETIDSPNGTYTLTQAVAVEPELIAPSDVERNKLSEMQVRALDRDYNGEAGGSWPKAKLTELQVNAFTQDAWDAYEGQFEIKRTDGFNRTWSFRHEIVKNHDHMMIECVRGPKVSRRYAITSSVTFGGLESLIRECDGETRR